MKQTLIVFALLLAKASFSQYYLRGEVRDALNQPLQGVKINLFSKGQYPYYSGSSGAFGIPTSLKIDTITIAAEGYELLKTAVETSKYAVFNLKPTETISNASHVRLSSFTKDFLNPNKHYTNVQGESYSNTIENIFIETKQFPETGYAVNVDRACYSNIRRFLNTRTKPPVDAVRIEEMLNYFNFSTEQTQPTSTFSANTTLTSCPWNAENQLLFINLKAKKINLDKTPPTNLVFLIDVSGSMDMPNRLPLVQSAFKLLVENLRGKDTVSIVTYGGTVAIALQPTSGNNKLTIIQAIERLTPNGSTPGESAIRVAYKVAKRTFIKGGNNRVILATDGDFNVGQTSEKDLEDLVNQERKSGIYLTCLGVGMGNYKDSKLEALAKKGNGNFAYIDNEKEAEKVLVEEFSQTLYNVASDVYLNLTFNPDLVKEYRLIGFENKLSTLEDTTGALEGGEVGSGHRLLSVFEITPWYKIDSPAIKPNELLAKINLNYQLPGEREVMFQQIDAKNNFIPFTATDSCLRFATSVIMFGGLLKQSRYYKNVVWDDVYTLASSSANSSNQLHTEFLEMVQKAKKIYGNNKKKW
ncbi:MAG: VWA domain-containing protein [Chitinophagaceae bacterium]|nr:VWA domain-containing protein [Chitinophagaceae bacterium]